MQDMQGMIFIDAEHKDSRGDPTCVEHGADVTLVSDLDDPDFAVVLLHALTRMAARSKRRQADLIAALRGAGIAVQPMKIRAALKILRDQGAIENLVPLSDGGLLLTVTHNPNDRAGPPPDWLSLEELDETTRPTRLQ